jgi:predicted permease
MLEISRLRVALGSVTAAVGLVIVGMATSTFQPMQDLIQLSIYMMIGGLAVFLIGMLLHHRLDDSDHSTEY